MVLGPLCGSCCVYAATCAVVPKVRSQLPAHMVGLSAHRLLGSPDISGRHVLLPTVS